MGDAPSPVDRVVRDAGLPGLVPALAELPGADLTTLLLEVMRRRAQSRAPADLLRAYAANRFAGLAAVPWAILRRTESAVLGAVPAAFERCELSPVVPFGTNSAVAAVDQHNVVSCLRGSEVLADPTNALALEAAFRRKALLADDPRSPQQVRLASSSRVVRAQQFEGAGISSHFQLLGLVTAGRDTGNRTFEQEAAMEHLRIAVEACRATGADAVRLDLTDQTDGEIADVLARVRQAFEGAPDVTVTRWPDRPSGRAYYDGFCMKVHATYGTTTLEVGDGGIVDWTQQLLASRKERLFISGLGLERMADPEGPPG